MKKCPYCKNPVQDHINKCPGCGAALEVISNIPQNKRADPNKILFEHKSFNYEVAIYPAYIAIKDKKGNGSIASHLVPQKSDISIKTITAVNLKGFLKRISLTLADGRIYELPEIFNKDAEKVRVILLELMKN